MSRRHHRSDETQITNQISRWIARAVLTMIDKKQAHELNILSLIDALVAACEHMSPELFVTPSWTKGSAALEAIALAVFPSAFADPRLPYGPLHHHGDRYPEAWRPIAPAAFAQINATREQRRTQAALEKRHADTRRTAANSRRARKLRQVAAAEQHRKRRYRRSVQELATMRKHIPEERRAQSVAWWRTFLDKTRKPAHDDE